VIKFLALLFLLLQPLVAAEKQEQQLQRFSPSLVQRVMAVDSLVAVG
jgi:hypothetical protein